VRRAALFSPHPHLIEPAKTRGLDPVNRHPFTPSPMKTLPSAALILSALSAGFLHAQTAPAAHTPPPLPPGVTVSHPHDNPLRDALRPVPKTALFKMDGYFVWDPSVIKVGDTYHLFASRWPAKDGMNGWFRSHAIRATSKSLFGPYEFREIVLTPETHPWAKAAIHNPKITKAGDKFLLYHLAIPQWQTGFAYADQIEGPWAPLPQPVIKTNNPALLIRKDGTAYAVGKFKPKVTKDGKWDAYMQAFEAPYPDGPYTLLGDAGNRLPADFEFEDPTIWWANNRYNILCNDWESKVTGIEKSMIYYTSADGIRYDLYSQIPVWSQSDPVPLDDGTTVAIPGVERPQVFQNEQGEIIAILAAIRPTGDAPSYIMIRPVDRFRGDSAQPEREPGQRRESETK
jgi:hypothetical protein